MREAAQASGTTHRFAHNARASITTPWRSRDRGPVPRSIRPRPIPLPRDLAAGARLELFVLLAQSTHFGRLDTEHHAGLIHARDRSEEAAMIARLMKPAAQDNTRAPESPWLMPGSTASSPRMFCASGNVITVQKTIAADTSKDCAGRPART